MHNDTINVVMADMPTTVVANPDLSYTIVLNPRHSHMQLLNAYHHAMKHIENGDFDKDCSVDLIEIYAHQHK